MARDNIIELNRVILAITEMLPHRLKIGYYFVIRLEKCHFMVVAEL